MSNNDYILLAILVGIVIILIIMKQGLLHHLSKKNDNLSVIILSYNRPHNLEKSLPILNKYKHIDEILVFHGHPDYYKEFKYDKVKNYKDYKLNETYGCARRWFHYDKVKNDNILFLDDDLLPDETFIINAYKEVIKNINTIYGIKKFTRICDKTGYHYTNVNYNTVLTGCSVMKKKIVRKYIQDNFKLYEDWIIKHHGNCEDLGFNIFIRDNYNETPQYVEGVVQELDTSLGYSNSPNNNHFKIRTNFCKLYS
jgi:hypothetical protein